MHTWRDQIRSDNEFRMFQKWDKEDAEKAHEDPEVCQYCNGTTLDLSGDSGGSCPHCFGGYLTPAGQARIASLFAGLDVP